MKRGQQGFTLMEVMISISLLAFVMIAVITITDNSQNAKERTLQMNKDNLQLEMALSRLEWDISQAWSPLYFSQKFQGALNPQTNPAAEEVIYHYERNPRFRMPSTEGLPIPILRSRDKEFTFLTTGHRRRQQNVLQSHFMWVKYALVDDKNEGNASSAQIDSAGNEITQTGKALGRFAYVNDPFRKEDLDEQDIRPSILLKNVEDLTFEFWNPGTQKWETNLLTVLDGDMVLRGFRISLKWIDSRGNKLETKRIFRTLWPLRVPVDSTTGSATGQSTATTNGSSTGTNTNPNNGQTSPGTR